MTDATMSLTRCNCFKLFAACLYEPDQNLFIEEQVVENLQNLLTSLDPLLADKAMKLRNGFEASSEEQLKVDHAALFIGPFELQAPPYGSLYMEKSGTVLGDTTVAVQRYYEQHGVSLDIREPADHICIELEFMSLLAAREAKARASGDHKEATSFFHTQARFFEQFMGWVPTFCSRIESSAHTDWYRALGDCLAAFYLYCSRLYRAGEDPR